MEQMQANIHLVENTGQNNSLDQTLLSELDSMILNENITTAFQPIFDTNNNTLYAFEALMRGPKDSALHSPETVFALSRKYNRVMELDQVCRKKAIESYKSLDLPGKLSINVCPSSLIDPYFKKGRTIQLLQEFEIPMDKVILEITEQQSFDHDELKTAARYYQDMGFNIALDDLGAGYSGLRLLAELKPNYIKLDKFFISDIHENDVAGDFVKLIVDLAARVNCRVIAEGVETLDEFDFVKKMSIHLVQGYLLAVPDENPSIDYPQDVVNGKAPKSFDSHKVQGAFEKERVSSLRILPTKTCSDTELASTILEWFQSDFQLQTVPVLSNGVVVGTLLRDEVLNLYSTPYAHSLYLHSNVKAMMLYAPLVAQLTDTLADVSRKATNRSFNHVYSPVIVCDGEKYVGTISIRDLLKNITECQIEHARHCNPLSGLPGNVRIEAEVQGRLDADITFSLLHFDLDNFKAFNDFYGYDRGDKMIHLVARLLQESARKNEFVGHIGGDDFVMIIADDAWEQRIWDMLESFSLRSTQLYDLQEQNQNFIETTDRTGILRQYNLASLSVSALHCDLGRFQSHLQIAEVLAEIKHRSKKIEGNSLVTDRRAA